MSIVERWFKGENPQTELSDRQVESFFNELKKQGFIRDKFSMQVHGLSGVYYLDKFEDDKGNIVYRQYGGRMPTKIDIYIPSDTQPDNLSNKDEMLEDNIVIKLLQEINTND